MGTIAKITMPSRLLVPGSDRLGILSGFEPGTRTLAAGTKLAAPFLELPVDIVFDRDVAVTLRDGTVTHVDLFRPVTDNPVPVIVAFSPYGKGQGSAPSAMGVFKLVGLENSIVSGLEKFEGPDPAYWCAQGYAICNPDIRVSLNPRVTACSGTARRAAMHMISSSGSACKIGATARSR